MLMSGEIYRDEYNNNEKINIMLHFLSEMLTSRMQFNKCTHEEMEKQFVDNYTGSQTSYNDSNYSISVYVTMEKLKNKTSVLKNFLNADNNSYKIFIADKTIQSIINMFNNEDNWELVNMYDIMSNRRTHISNPVFEQLTAEEQEQVKTEYKATDTSFSGLERDDAMVLYYNLKPGEIIRIIRPSTTAGQAVQYRKVK